MSTDLGARLSVRTFTVEELVNASWQGRIRVPYFQRDFRWTRRDVIQLFDSIARGYPIGSLLLWERPAPQQTLHLGELELDVPRVDSAHWVVDGQQRIISLANALHPTTRSTDPFNVSYDLPVDEFIGRSWRDTPLCVPLGVMFDLQRLIQWFAEHPEAAAYFDKATAVATTIRQYAIPAYQVEQGDEGILIAMFDRLNNSGRKLTRAEVFDAIHVADENRAAAPLTLSRIVDNIDSDLKFGPIDKDSVLKAILARRGPNTTRDTSREFTVSRLDNIDFPNEDRNTSYRASQDSLRRTVRFLQEIADVPHHTLLPYRYLLVTLSRFFSHFPDPSQSDLRLLRRWYWRAALTGLEPFNGLTTLAIRQLSSRIRPGDINGSIAALLDAVNENPTHVPELTEFRASHPATKMLLCAWWSLRPRSPLTSQQYSRADLASILGDKKTPQESVLYIIQPGRIGKEKLSTVANRIMIPSLDEPVDEIDSFIVLRPEGISDEEWVKILASHNLTLRSVELLGAGLIESFLDERQATISTQFRHFLEVKCEWGFEDTPSIDSLIVEDEN